MRVLMSASFRRYRTSIARVHLIVLGSRAILHERREVQGHFSGYCVKPRTKRSKSFRTSSGEMGWRDVNATTAPLPSIAGAALSSIHGPERPRLTGEI